MRWLNQAGVALASIVFCGLPLACGDDEASDTSATPDAAVDPGTTEQNSDDSDSMSSDDSTRMGALTSSDTMMSTGAANTMTSSAEPGDGGMHNMDASSSAPMPMMDGGADAGADGFDPQLPPTNADAMGRWLAMGYYLDWVCETEPNSKTDGASAIHVHGAATRVCTNVLLAASVAPGTSGQFPAGVAAVKEVFDADQELVATVVSVKTKADSAAGDNWYWYGGPETEGLGLAGCKGCHGAAASDDDHPGAGDFVYFQTKDEAQLPPVSEPEEIEAWLAQGHYLDWTCEDEPSVKTDGAEAIHVHPKNRICVNSKLAASELTDGEWPAGVAAVKELYANDADGGAMTGAVLYTKIGGMSQGGDGWFWFAGEGATGFGVAGCTGCHGAAGSDVDHPGAGDYVYDRVVE